MGISPSFKMVDVRAKLEADAKKIERIIILRLQYLGEECVNIARSLSTYTDQTGNLRNSIGYIIARNGVVVKDNFSKTASVKKVSKKGKESRTKGSGDGVKVGKELALEVLAGKRKGYALIVVAGMNYAHAVELKNFDVLTSAEQYAKKELPGMIARLKGQINAMK